MTTYQLTDKITDATVIVAGHDVEEALREWNPEAPDDVLQACTDLGAALAAGTYTGDLEALLQVEVMQIAKDALPTTGTLTARLVRINDLTWSDERGAEISQDLIEVRDGDLVLGEVWVESSEDEAPYAAAVAEFGDVTWL